MHNLRKNKRNIAIFKRIYNMKIGFQGDIFSNAEEATDRFIKKLNVQNVVPVALITSKNVVSSLINKEIDYGVMAIKNSIAGDVAETKEALTEHIELVDTAEIDIHHCLFTKNNQAKIHCVASHIQALMQTVNNRKKILNNVIEVECIDTALAAKMLFSGEYPENYAVICRKNAGNFYNLHLLAENIEDDKSNKTLFGLFKLK